MREIVTLQLGHLSNYVATHFWNAQVQKTANTPLAAHGHPRSQANQADRSLTSPTPTRKSLPSTTTSTGDQASGLMDQKLSCRGQLFMISKEASAPSVK